MNNSLTRFVNSELSLDIYIDSSDNHKVYWSLSSYASFSGKAKSTIHQRLQGVRSEVIKDAEALTAGGLQGVRLLPETLISKWIVKDNPNQAENLIRLGVRKFSHDLVGYQIDKPVPVSQVSEKEQLDNIHQATRTAYCIDTYIKDPLLKSALTQRLAEVLGQACVDKALPCNTNVPRQVLLNVRAKELGITQSQVNQSDRRGYWSLGAVIARDFIPLGKTQHGKYPVNVYEQTERLDRAILEYFQKQDESCVD